MSVIDYSAKNEEFNKQATTNKNGGDALTLIDETIKRLEKVASRARAGTCKTVDGELLLARCQACRFRLIQYLIGLDRHAATSPDISNSKHKRWTIQSLHTTTQRTPDEHARLLKLPGIITPLENFMQFHETHQTVAKKALKQFAVSHPGTPWTSAAQFELSRASGLNLKSEFRSPRYQEVGKRIKILIFKP